MESHHVAPKARRWTKRETPFPARGQKKAWPIHHFMRAIALFDHRSPLDGRVPSLRKTCDTTRLYWSQQCFWRRLHKIHQEIRWFPNGVTSLSVVGKRHRRPLAGAFTLMIDDPKRQAADGENAELLLVSPQSIHPTPAELGEWMFDFGWSTTIMRRNHIEIVSLCFWYSIDDRAGLNCFGMWLNRPTVAAIQP